MFIEKFPPKLFTQRILNAFFELAKTLFINMNKGESICDNYFKHILLNEKILSKYNINLQIEFWNKLYLFCQSDKTQIETFININRICLILRFYDRNKYTEMCCEDHLNMIKDEYVGSKKIMNPPRKAMTGLWKSMGITFSRGIASIIRTFLLEWRIMTHLSLEVSLV